MPPLSGSSIAKFSFRSATATESAACYIGMLASEHRQIGIVHHQIRYRKGVGQFRSQSDIFYNFDGVFIVAGVAYEMFLGAFDVSLLRFSAKSTNHLLCMIEIVKGGTAHHAMFRLVSSGFNLFRFSRGVVRLFRMRTGIFRGRSASGICLHFVCHISSFDRHGYRLGINIFAGVGSETL